MLVPLVYSFVNLSKIVFQSFQATFSFTKETCCKVCSISLTRTVTCLSGLLRATEVSPPRALSCFSRCVSGGRFSSSASRRSAAYLPFLPPPLLRPCSLLPFLLLVPPALLSAQDSLSSTSALHPLSFSQFLSCGEGTVSLKLFPHCMAFSSLTRQQTLLFLKKNFFHSCVPERSLRISVSNYEDFMTVWQAAKTEQAVITQHVFSFYIFHLRFAQFCILSPCLPLSGSLLLYIRLMQKRMF